jgi:hypothetical protein
VNAVQFQTRLAETGSAFLEVQEREKGTLF